ncbi:hypothetical protein HanPI659440_Chr07g0275361 [Helianthus annuus]|nr:hypothetical protein HanPI659440_Chr07g0275361 [Helianthus annuus]
MIDGRMIMTRKAVGIYVTCKLYFGVAMLVVTYLIPTLTNGGLPIARINNLLMECICLGVVPLSPCFGPFDCCHLYGLWNTRCFSGS